MILLVKINIKEEKNYLKSSVKLVIDRDKTNDKYLYEKIIKKSITKIDIFDGYNKLNESISKTIKSDLKEEDSKTKSANEFLCNKPILNNYLTFTKNTKIINITIKDVSKIVNSTSFMDSVIKTALSIIVSIFKESGRVLDNLCISLCTFLTISTVFAPGKGIT